MNLLLTGCFDYSDEQLARLEALGFSVYFMQWEEDLLPIPADSIDAVVCNALFLHHDIDEFANLRYIQLTSVGLDRVPIERIGKRNITLHNARSVYSIPMAEWAVFRVLEHFKCGRHFANAQGQCRWSKNRDLREIVGCRVAVVGAGCVGQEVAKRFKAFGTDVVGFDIHIKSTAGFDKMLYTRDLDGKIGGFDIVVITAPLTASTHHLFSKVLLLKLKHNAVLINIARGALIDEAALIEVLEERTDLFAALDVFENEPLDVNNRLWKLPNVALSPHNSFVSDGNNHRMFALIYDNLKDYLYYSQSLCNKRIKV